VGVVGIGKIIENNLPDNTAKEKPNPWVAPKIAFVKKFKRMITLDEIKKDRRLSKMVLLKIPRLSVQPVTAAEFKIIEKLGF
jgi:predicted RNA-binding protein with PUA-like domain